MICYIIDDQYGKQIYEWLSARHQDWFFPIKENVMNPLELKESILENNPEYILLDNFFPNRWHGREEPLGNELLESILPHLKTTKIISISDYWTKLLDQFDAWEQWRKSWSVIWFVDTKHSTDIDRLIV